TISSRPVVAANGVAQALGQRLYQKPLGGLRPEAVNHWPWHDLVGWWASRSSAPAIIVFVRCSVSQRCCAIHFSASAWDREWPTTCGRCLGYSISRRQ